MVTAKCWALLFAIRDWYLAIKAGYKNPPMAVLEPSFKDLFKDYLKIKKRGDDVDKKIRNWEVRKIKIGVDVPSKGSLKEYADHTPEKEAIKFIEYWVHRNYGQIAEQIYHPATNPISHKKEAGRVREFFKNKELIDYKIIKITDCSPSISEITLDVVVESGNRKYNKRLTLRLIYEGSNGEIFIIGETGGRWKFIDTVFYDIVEIGIDA
jgi:hypothetical protein